MKKQFRMGAKFTNRLFTISWVLVCMTGLMPMIVGTYVFINFIEFNSSFTIENWLNGVCVQNEMPLKQSLQDTAAQYVMMFHVMAVNLMNTGFLVIIIALFWYRKTASRIAWFALSLSLMWTAGNDFIALTRQYYASSSGMIPIPAVPLVLGMIALCLGVPRVFGRFSH